MQNVQFSRRLVLGLASSALLIVLTTAVFFSWDDRLHSSLSSFSLSLPSFSSSSDSSTTSTCPSQCPVDPYSLPGMTIYTREPNETRWIVFPFERGEFDNLEAPIRNEDLRDPYGPLSPDVDARAAPRYMMDLALHGEDAGEKIGWAGGKMVLFIGSSHDRNNIGWFCNYVKGDYIGWGAHVGGFCTIPWLNLTIAHWFLYGMVDDEEYDWFRPTDVRPITFEKRITDVMLPLMAQFGIDN